MRFFCFFFGLIVCLSPCSFQAQELDKKASVTHQELKTPVPLFAVPEGSSFLPQVSKVNVITGEYCEDSCDLVIAGAEPISIRRFYNQFTGHQEQMYGHWRINPETFMIFNFEGKQPYAKLFAGVGSHDSNFYLYEKKNGNCFTTQSDKCAGFTNTICALSGHNHPLNHSVSYRVDRKEYRNEFYVNEWYHWWEGVIKDGTGTERHFKTDARLWPMEWNDYQSYKLKRNWDHNDRVYFEKLYFEFIPPYQAQIVEERRPSGNVIRYEYEDCYIGVYNRSPELPTSYMLKSIKAYSSQGVFLGSIDITYERHFPTSSLDEPKVTDRVHFKGSDGRSADYMQPVRTVKKHYVYDTLLSKVTASGKPTQIYNYQDIRNDRKNKYIRLPFIFQAGEENGPILETTYGSYNRVSEQLAPVGLKGEKVPIFRYSYETDHTICYDGEGHKTIYRFNSDKRITSVEKYFGNELYSVEKNLWDKATGNLFKKTIEDVTGTTYVNTEYVYDHNQNVVEERVAGELPIYRTYSQDGFNLKLSESDRPGKEIRYTYLPRTNLLTSEIVSYQGQIKKRKFHFYDQQLGSVCIKTIIDDGLSDNPNDLHGVTFRRITEIDPKRSIPCIGLPEEIREYAGETLLKKIRYTYHPSGKIASEEHFDSQNHSCYTIINTYDQQERLISTQDPLGHITKYEYDSRFNLIAQYGPRPDQHKEWRYDAADRPIQELEWQSDGTILISHHEYDKNSRLIATVDYLGNRTEYTYDPLGRLIIIQHPDGALEKKEYNVLGHIIKEEDSNGFVTTKTLNHRGQPITINHSDGTTERFTYHPTGTLAEHTNSQGITTQYTYDWQDRKIRTENTLSISSAAYSPFNLLSKTDPLGETAEYTYDLAGRLLEERLGDKRKQISYDSLGQIASIQEGDVTTKFLHDYKGQLCHKSIPGLFEESYAYDEAGNQIAKTTCMGTTSTTYNTRGEPILIKNPLGETTEITYSYQGSATKTVRDPKGVKRITIYDSRGRACDVQTKDRAGELIQRSEKKYDPCGNQIQATEHLFEGTQLKRAITRSWSYGPKGRLESVTENEEKKTQYLYDLFGRLATVIKPDGRSIYREYDEGGRLARYYGEGIDYRYIYDAKNRLLSITDQRAQTTLKCSYDRYDNMITETLPTGLTLKREFDPYGKCLTLQLPDSTSITYSYLGPYLHSVARHGSTVTYASRNLAGKPTQILLPSRDTIEITYDPLLRWKAYKSPGYSAAYEYDNVGNLTSYKYTDLLGREELTYCYDDLNQLTSEGSHVYSYDSLYNRRQKNGLEYHVNDLLQVTDDGQKNYQYDLNGNLISTGTDSYEYDLLDRLITVIRKGKSYHYTYDALNRRVAKNGDLYIWDGQREIGMMQRNQIKELRILGQGRGGEIGAAVLLEVAGVTYIPLHDHRGSVVALLNSVGAKLYVRRYTSFGEIDREFPTPWGSPWGFASKRHDPETGLVYFGKRYYSPTLGRWITTDPQGFQDGPNLYAYVHNNPLAFCDPDGLFATSFAETRNVGEKFWYCASRTIEFIGHHCIPLPVVRDVVEGAGRWGRGGNFYQERERPCILSSSGFKLQHQTHIYVNGMLTDKTAAIQQRDAISKEYGGVQVDLFYNPTQGFICDLLKSLVLKCGVKMAHEKMGADYISNILTNDPLHQFNILGHSQGSTRINNMGDLIHPDYCRQNISVDSFGGATIIPEGRFKTVHNFVSCIDGVSMTSTWRYFKNVVGMDDNITFLTPETKNPLTEHFLCGDTYWKKITELGDEFITKHLNE